MISNRLIVFNLDIIKSRDFVSNFQSFLGVGPSNPPNGRGRSLPYIPLSALHVRAACESPIHISLHMNRLFCVGK